MRRKKAKRNLLLSAAALVLVGCMANPGADARRSGWVEIDGQSCYYLEGQPVTGWMELEGNTYYFDGQGQACTGLASVGGVTYAFREDGTLASGWTEIGGVTHLIGEDGIPLSGWQEVSGHTYYLNADGSLCQGWLEDGGHTYYMRDGLYTTGILKLEASTFFFDSRGWQILMVNPWNTVPEGYDTELVSISEEHAIAAAAASDFADMMAAMREVDLEPRITSSYRTITRQEELFSERVAAYMNEGYGEEEAYAATAASVAIPGTSEHQLGLAVDMSDANYVRMDEGQMETPTQLWLIENSWRYGFILRYPNGRREITGIIYEPWHYRYVGKELAAELYELDLTMEEYLDMLTGDKMLTASNPANGNTAQ